MADEDLLDRILDVIIDDEWTGHFGEKLTARELKHASFHGCKGEVLLNVYVPKMNHETSEIDVLFICKKGILVLESKNYSGWIFGNESDRNWTQVFEGGKKYRFYNPIWQNRSHIKYLKEFLDEDVPMFSIVVFSQRCELKKITTTSDDTLVIKRPNLQASVGAIFDKFPDVLTGKQVKDIYHKLKPLTDEEEAIKQAHVMDIQARYQASGDKPHYSNKQEADRAMAAGDEEPEPCGEPLGGIAETAAQQAASKATGEIQQDTMRSKRTNAPIDAIATERPTAVPAEQTNPTTQSSSDRATADNASVNTLGAGEADRGTPSPGSPDSLICPRCGGHLVLRTAKRGKYAGNQFYGCSNYPNCHYIRNL